jgi:hypothetical protein
VLLGEKVLARAEDGGFHIRQIFIDPAKLRRREVRLQLRKTHANFNASVATAS